MDHFDKLKNQLVNSYESTVAIEGDEICKEVDSLISDNFALLREKAHTYCYICTEMKKDVDTKLYDKCEKYLKHLRYYNDLKSFFTHHRQPTA